MSVYKPGELGEALKEVDITTIDVVQSKAAEIEEAAHLFLTRRQAETNSPPYAVISRLTTISNLAGKLHAILTEGADPNHELAEGDLKRAADRSLRSVIFVTAENKGSLVEEPLKTFTIEGLDEEFTVKGPDGEEHTTLLGPDGEFYPLVGPDVEYTDWSVDREFDLSIRAVATVRDWAKSALIKERNRKASGRRSPSHQANDALDELFDRLVEISDHGPETSEPSFYSRRKGKVAPYGPLIRYLKLCLEPLKDHVKKLTPGALRNRVRRLKTRTKE